jgi:hypothetical protein
MRTIIFLVALGMSIVGCGQSNPMSDDSSVEATKVSDVQQGPTQETIDWFAQFRLIGKWQSSSTISNESGAVEAPRVMILNTDGTALQYVRPKLTTRITGIGSWRVTNGLLIITVREGEFDFGRRDTSGSAIPPFVAGETVQVAFSLSIKILTLWFKEGPMILD